MMHGVRFFRLCSGYQLKKKKFHFALQLHTLTHHNEYVVERNGMERCTFEITNCFTYFVSGFCSKCHCVIYFLSLKFTATIAQNYSDFHAIFSLPQTNILSLSLYVWLLTNVSISLCLGKLQLQFLFSSLHHMHPSLQVNLNEKRNGTKRYKMNA